MRPKCDCTDRSNYRLVEKQLLVFEMAALRKILGVRIIDKMRNDDIRKALNQTEAIIKKFT